MATEVPILRTAAWSASGYNPNRKEKFPMGKIESYVPGSFCWAELATNDTAAAKRFYGEMFGWTAVDLPLPEGSYTLLKSAGEDAAALCPAQPGVPVHWGVYFSVANADQSAAQVAPSG